MVLFGYSTVSILFAMWLRKLQKTARHHIVGRWVFSKLPSDLGQQESSEHVKPLDFFLLHVNQVWWVWVRFEVTSLLNFRCLCRTEVVGSSLQRLAYLWSFTAVAGTTLQERCVSFVRFPWLPFLDVCRIRSGEARV